MVEKPGMREPMRQPLDLDDSEAVALNEFVRIERKKGVRNLSIACQASN
jgi:hypothetical protein